MDRAELRVETGDRLVTDVTGHVERFCHGKGDGLVHAFAPHATAGLALLELGSGSEADLAELLARVLPRDNRYVHRHGSTGHGADHLLPALVSPTVVLVVADGEVQLGTWQRIALVDTNGDNPVRTLQLTFLRAGG